MRIVDVCFIVIPICGSIVLVLAKQYFHQPVNAPKRTYAHMETMTSEMPHFQEQAYLSQMETRGQVTSSLEYWSSLSVRSEQCSIAMVI